MAEPVDPVEVLAERGARVQHGRSLGECTPDQQWRLRVVSSSQVNALSEAGVPPTPVGQVVAWRPSQVEAYNVVVEAVKRWGTGDVRALTVTQVCDAIEAATALGLVLRPVPPPTAEEDRDRG